MKVPLDTYLSPMSVAKRRNSSQDTVLRAIYDGDLKGIQVIGPNGSIVAIGVHPKDAEAWVPRLRARKLSTPSGSS